MKTNYLGEIVNVETNANIRDIPSTRLSPVGTIDKGEYIPIIPDYYNPYWYRVSYDGQPGYIHKSLVN